MQKNFKDIIAKMTLEEKAKLCSGLGLWHTKPVEHLGVPSIMMTDGPHGLRKTTGADLMDLSASEPATCFPTAAGMASSWDKNLIREMGEGIAEEAQALGVSIVLGPGVNIKRSPLCGRNFEYFSEDPYLAGEMAANYIQAVEGKGVGTSLKHFAVNNQEHRRMSVTAKVDERTLREIYLPAFEKAVKKGKPSTVMCSYNRINGVYSSDNEWLLTKLLREEWGYEGLVVSDWGAVNERVQGILAGMDLQMPGSDADDNKIIKAVKVGKLDEKALDVCVERILNLVFDFADKLKPEAKVDFKKHYELARRIAGQCMVLLKNQNGVLPAKKSGKVAVIGAFAKQPRTGGGGSSLVNSAVKDNALEEITKLAGESNVRFAQGFDLTPDEGKKEQIDEAVAAAKAADYAFIFAGVPFETEGDDRQDMSLPVKQNDLIHAVAAAQPNTVVVITGGAPIEMPWVNEVAGILEGYLGSEASGGAATDILYGIVNPSAKLAETFPLKVSDNPSYLNFPGEGDEVNYAEGLFVGYRYYDKKQMPVLFPFGHGLSYTTFEYTGISVDKKSLNDQEKVNVKISVKNTGKVAGKEIVQLYVRDIESGVIRPVKELKAFEKVQLAPGEEKTVELTLCKRAFAYYDTELKDWQVESGDFELLAGGSSVNLPLSVTVHVDSTTPKKKVFTQNSTLGDLMADPVGSQIVAKMLAEFTKGQQQALPPEAMEMMKDMPIRAIASFAGSGLDEQATAQLLAALNAPRG